MGLPAEKLLSYEDYAALPDDGRRYELIEGRLVLVPSPLLAHQRGATNLVRLLGDHVLKHGLGEVFAAPFDVILDEHDTVQPDVLFVSREHSDRIQSRGVLGPPDLVVEILSEGTASKDCIKKRDLFERSGVSEYWLVNPADWSILVLTLEAGSCRLFSEATGSQRVRSKLFPDLELTPEQLFAAPRYDP